MVKASAYNHFIRAGNRTLAYNAVSNGLALIDDEVLKALQSPESIDALISSRLQGESATLLRELKRGRFVIESDFDEIEYLRLLYNRAKYDVVAAGLTIAPTLDCNFNCTYCYEEQRSSRMTDEVKQHLCRYVAQIVKVARSFQVTWYGGEPLLCPDVIEELSKEFLKACEENHCAYHASIVTNGSLLTRETALALKEHKIETAQITFDGPREVHDSRRCYRDGRGSFDTIVANIEATRDVLRIAIRVNVDRTNMDHIVELFTYLRDRGILQEGQTANAYLGHVHAPTAACKDIEGNCLDAEGFSRFELDVMKQLNERGFHLSRYPDLRMGSCGAVRPYVFVVDPEGNMYKCWHSIGISDEVVGHISRPGEMTAAHLKWLSFDPFKFPECLSCKIFPICMAGCPDTAMKGGIATGESCERWRYYLDDMLRLHAENVRRAKESGKVEAAG